MTPLSVFGWACFVVAAAAIGWSVNAAWVAGEFDPYLHRARHKRGRGMPRKAGRVWPLHHGHHRRGESA